MLPEGHIETLSTVPYDPGSCLQLQETGIRKVSFVTAQQTQLVNIEMRPMS